MVKPLRPTNVVNPHIPLIGYPQSDEVTTTIQMVSGKCL